MFSVQKFMLTIIAISFAGTGYAEKPIFLQDLKLNKKQEEVDLSIRLRSLELKKILKHKEYFTYMMKVHRLAQFSVLVGIPLYQLYSILSHRNLASGDVAGHVEPVVPSQPMLERFIHFGKGCCAAVVNEESWITGAKFVSKIGLVVGTNMVLSKCTKMFDHDQTIDWCVRKYAPYKTTFKQLHKNITEQMNNGDTEKIFFGESFISGFEILIGQLEYGIGFIKYKSESLPEKKVQEGKDIAEYLIKITNELSDGIKELYSKSDVCLQEYVYLLQSFEKKLSAEIEHFALIDPEKDEQEDENKMLKHQIGNLAQENVKLRATLLAAIQNAGLSVPEMTTAE